MALLLISSGAIASVDAQVTWLELDTNVVGGTPRRAIYWTGVSLAEVTDALVGTGKKPIVMMADGTLKERATTEGSAVIMVNGQLWIFNPITETLTL